jgi:hypothetical protein
MEQENITELGSATNLRVTRNPRAPGTYSLLFRSAGGEQHEYLFTESAIRFLWHYLTEELYPRAAGSLTSKSETAKYSIKPSSYAIFLLKVTARDGHIEIAGTSTMSGCRFRLSREDGYELWTALEDILHNVQAKEDA